MGISISLSVEQLEKLESLAEKSGMKKSQFIAYLLDHVEINEVVLGKVEIEPLATVVNLTATERVGIILTLESIHAYLVQLHSQTKSLNKDGLNIVLNTILLMCSSAQYVKSIFEDK